ncbi:MAG: acyl carrier protein [Pyrinomonadaceae bacterium]
MLDDLTQEVIKVIAETQHIPVEKISLDSTFEELDIDSLGGMGLVFELESKFNVSIPNEEALQMRTVRQAVESMKKLLDNEAMSA